MRKSRFSDEQIIAILREQEAGHATPSLPPPCHVGPVLLNRQMCFF